MPAGGLMPNSIRALGCNVANAPSACSVFRSKPDRSLTRRPPSITTTLPSTSNKSETHQKLNRFGIKSIWGEGALTW
eukprot:3770996-Prymnesium_polylepis.1